MNRRSFLKLAIGAVVAFSVLPSLPTLTPTPPPFDPLKYKGDFHWRKITGNPDIEMFTARLVDNTHWVWENRMKEEYIALT
jgi:hypothetical protein